MSRDFHVISIAYVLTRFDKVGGIAKMDDVARRVRK